MFEIYATDIHFQEHLMALHEGPERAVQYVAREYYDKNSERLFRTHWRPARSVLQRFEETEQQLITHCISSLVHNRVTLSGHNLASCIEDFVTSEMDQGEFPYFDAELIGSTITKLKSMAPLTCEQLLRESSNEAC